MRTTLSLLAMASMGQAAQQEKCHALVLSGGANRGAYEVGIMWGLTHYGNPEDFKWDVVSGVSAGAINAAASSVFAPEDTVAMTEFLSYCWQTMTSEDVWTLWPTGTVKDWFMDEPGLLDTSAAVPFLESLLAPFSEFKKRFTIAAVDQNTGNYVPFNQNNIKFEEVATAAFGAGSIPALLPPQYLQGMVLMDGGTEWSINIDSAVKQCFELVDNEEDIILDIVECNNLLPYEGTVQKNALQNLLEAHKMKKYWNGIDTVQPSLYAYPDVQVRSFFALEEKFGNCTMVTSKLDFNNQSTFCLQEVGRSMAKSFIETGEFGYDSTTTLAEWYDGLDEEVEQSYFGSMLNRFIGN